MLMLDFNEYGLLPQGDYLMNFGMLRTSILVLGNSNCDEEWDSQWRLQLVDNLQKLVNELWEVGITEIFIDGSFVTNKPHPNDIDGYFVCDVMRVASGDIERDLNKINPHKIWTWDPKSLRPCRGSTKRQLPMWHKYRVELYPEFGQFFGALDEYGNPLQFPAAFRKERYSRRPKGIIKIVK
ncbi:MAG: hypothetical protein AWM53_00198 [Candidatus Dichloromethanomonas elyunquensis]|nr:MAG: hypothetical protein AWM53_00198 [Candidatus Dichloromethanomonas elyunquensis]